VGQHRGKLRDALTLFDENAAILICKGFAAEKLPQALRNKDWHSVFIEQRGSWTDTELIIVGHALLEKLVVPRKAMTAHVFCPLTPLDAAQPVDAQLAVQLHPAHLATKPYAPLPVMGVPDWCAQNAEARFYDDAQVFRIAKLC
jgi:Protein of unknown function (DUF3025)